MGFLENGKKNLILTSIEAILWSSRHIKPILDWLHASDAEANRFGGKL
jgi:hypothetical protein